MKSERNRDNLAGKERKRCAAIAWSFVEIHTRHAESEPGNSIGYRRRIAQAKTAHAIYEAIVGTRKLARTAAVTTPERTKGTP